MGHIFISYSHKDSKYAHALTNTLQGMGFEVWIDERLDYGSQWPHELQRRLDSCEAFLLIMSPDSFASEWVQSELQRAKRKLKPIFPLLLQGDEPWLSVESTQYFDVRGERLPDEKFYTALKRVLSVNPKATTYTPLPKSYGKSVASQEPARTQPTGSWTWLVIGGGTVALTATVCVALVIWMVGPSLFRNFPTLANTPTASLESPTSDLSSIATPTSTQIIPATTAPTVAIEPTTADASSSISPIYIRVKVLTGNDGTINTPQITFHSESGVDETFEMNDLNAFRPNQYDEFVYIVSRDFCDFVGYTLTKPADSNGDDPWNVEEVFIYIDNVLVFGDGDIAAFSPITSDSQPPNGYWAETDVYKQRCGG